MTLLLSLVAAFSFGLRVQSGVPMCNDQGYMFPFADLTDVDVTRIERLVQLQIVARHGARSGNIPISEIFPRVNLSKPGADWTCNFTQITSRVYDDEEFMAFQKNYIEGEEYVGRNCLDQQSLYPVIIQHKTTAKLIRNYYIGEEKYNLWSTDELNRIMYDTFIERKYPNNNVPHIKIISSDIERAYATASVFFKYFLSYASNEDATDGSGSQSQDSYESIEALEAWKYNRNTDYLYSYAHDAMNDPYIPQKVQGCINLKKYINQRGRNSKNAQAYLKSDYVKGFYKQWKEEVGTTFNHSYHKFKYCENIMWMYCGGLNVVPGAISQSLFDKVHNYTLEYRAKSLNNEISRETVTLASMPFAWILSTLVADRVHYLEGNEEEIDGYLDAKRAKLVFHSTRGISTLYLLRALNISSGMEPVYGNLVNFEVYKRSQEDYPDNSDADQDGSPFGKYLFRILFMGKFVAFPGCEDEYKNGESSLCNLSVFMEALKNLSMAMPEWVPYCANITNTYFSQPKKKHALDYVMETAKNAHQSGGTVLFFVGGAAGAFIVWFFDRKRYIKSVFKEKYETI